MLFAQPGRPYEEHERLVRAMEVLFILHADHEQNCSTNAVRSVASSGNDLFTAARPASAPCTALCTAGRTRRC